MRTTDQTFGTADVLKSTAENGEVRAGLGYLSQGGEGIDAGAVCLGPDGFISRPNEPDADKAALAFYLKDANRKYVLGIRDNRYADKVGSLDPGDRAIVTNGEARVMVKQVDDSVTLYTVNKKVDSSMMVALDGSTGELNLLSGKANITVGEDEDGAFIELKCGNASLALYEDGTIQINGATFTCATLKGSLGIISPQPPVLPVAPANGIAYALGGLTASANWSVAP